MCPFVLLTFFFSVLILLAELASAAVTVTFHPSSVQLHEGQSHRVAFTISSLTPESLHGKYRFEVDRPDVADIQVSSTDFTITPTEVINGQYSGGLNVSAKFLGYSHIRLNKIEEMIASVGRNKTLNDLSQLTVSVIRDKTLISKIFVFSVAIAVSISYINMGCALDMSSVYEVLRYPVAPAIGLFSQYICMPLVSNHSELGCRNLISNSLSDIVCTDHVSTGQNLFQIGTFHFWLQSRWWREQHVDSVVDGKSQPKHHDDLSQHTALGGRHALLAVHTGQSNLRGHYHYTANA